jgi:DNA-binding transcriptional regulator YiaG
MVKKETLRKLRESAGMTRAEMAELLRVPLTTLEKWEADSLDMKAKALLGLFAARDKK